MVNIFCETPLILPLVKNLFCLGEVVTGSPSDKPDSPVKNGLILALDYDSNGAK